jgi:TetR/AcrR family transcriptional regulator
MPENEIKTETSRNRILLAALSEFAKFGLGGARVDEIARRADINKQAIYYYFGSKESLFKEALTFGYKQGLPSVDLDPNPNLSPQDEMRQLIGFLFEHFRGIPQVLQIIAQENHARGEHLTPVVKEGMREAVRPILRAVRRILRRGQKAGVFRPRIDPDQLYLTIISTCMFMFGNAFTLSAILGEDLMSDRMIARRRQHLQDILVAGIQIQPNG